MLFNFFKKQPNINSNYKNILDHFHTNYKHFIYFEFEDKNISLYTIIYNLNDTINIENYLEKNELEFEILTSDATKYFIFKNNNKYIVFVPKLNILSNVYNNNYFLSKLTQLLAKYNIKDNKLIQKYSYDLYSYLNVHIKHEPIINKLKEVYKVVHQEKNKIIINSYIPCNKYILNISSGYQKLPEPCVSNVHQISFLTNQNNELLEVVVDIDKPYHPNIKDNKYCLGSYRHNQLSFELIQSIIDNVRLYNLTNYHSIHKVLKEHLLKT